MEDLAFLFEVRPEMGNVVEVVLELSIIRSQSVSDFVQVFLRYVSWVCTKGLVHGV